MPTEVLYAGLGGPFDQHIAGRWRFMMPGFASRDYAQVLQVENGVVLSKTRANWIIYAAASQLEYLITSQGGLPAFVETSSIMADNGATGTILTDDGMIIMMQEISGDWSSASTFTRTGDSTIIGSITNYVQSAGALPAGHYAFINDAAGTDLGAFVFCATTSEFGINGIGGFYNADYGVAGNYSGVTGYAGNLGVWNSGLAPSIHEVVIWNGIHYINLTGSVGTAPGGDTTNWTPLTKSVTAGYIEEWDIIQYNFTSNTLIGRKDKLGNVVEDSGQPFATGAIQAFQWGNTSVINNYIQSNSIYTCINQRGGVYNNVVKNECRVTTDNTHTGSVNNSTFSFDTNLVISKNGANSFGNNTVSTNASFTSSVSDTEEWCVCNSVASNFQCSIDITGITTLDITSANNYCGIVNVTSTHTTETINTILNCPVGFPVTIIPQNGLTLTVDSTAIGSITSGAIALEGNANITLVGRSAYIGSTLSDFLTIIGDGVYVRQVGGSIL